MAICARCNVDVVTTMMSMFNTETICIPCKKHEEHCPDYKRAVAEELRQVKKGNFNYEGIGLTKPIKTVEEYPVFYLGADGMDAVEREIEATKLRIHGLMKQKEWPEDPVLIRFVAHWEGYTRALRWVIKEAKK